DRGARQRQPGARGGDEPHLLAFAVGRASVIDAGHVDVDADHAGGDATQKRGPVALAAGDVEHPLPLGEAPREGVAVPMLVGDLATDARQETLAGEFRLGSLGIEKRGRHAPKGRAADDFAAKKWAILPDPYAPRPRAAPTL